jgi:glyoxylase-like metal-dependent hydrolase (beta-lactamase superfamily II)
MPLSEKATLMVQENHEKKKHENADVFSVAPGVWGKKDLFVNYYFVQDRESDSWVLVDAGMKWSAARIIATAGQLFGAGKAPAAIILTHGHFDHVGALETLLQEWHVPVYSHSLEMPYLTGRSSYPPADPSVGGGMMSTMSWMYPRGPIHLAGQIKSLPGDNSLPVLKEWKYIHTPGHSPGHISLFRETDKVLIAGDAFVTTKQESALYALSYRKHLSGPPKYFTCNWASAKISVLKLAALDPEIVATGHGVPMFGQEMRNSLHRLSRRFDDLALPAHGRYVNEPAVTDETGVLYLPPAVQTVSSAVKVVAASLAVLSIGLLIYQQARKKKANPEAETILDKIAKPVRRAVSSRWQTFDKAFAK